MMLSTDPRLPAPNPSTQSLTQRLYEVFGTFARAFNGSAMWDGEAITIPVTGSWAAGDKVKHSAPVEVGSVASKYVIIGWVCVASGTPGTWKEMRVLTGG